MTNTAPVARWDSDFDVLSRCAGSNLARMELRVALEEWLRRIPSFGLAEGAEVTWAGGQVRGPRQLEVVFP